MTKIKIEGQRSATDNSRIPGIICTKNGVLITYYEYRCGDGGDWANISIGMRKSSDDGDTWSSRKFLVESNGQTINNPVMIADEERVHFLYEQNYNECFYQYSCDDGDTWSEPCNITSVFDDFRTEYGWESFGIGPGHGIKLSTGRLLIPVWLSALRSHGKPVSACIFSDDHGRTWKRGAIMYNAGEVKNANETCAAELSNGDVFFNHRAETIKVMFPEFRDVKRIYEENEDSRYRCRISSISHDGGITCEKMQPVFELKDPCCQGSMTTYEKDGQHIVFFSNCNSDSCRIYLTVKHSVDDCHTWSDGILVEVNAGYSDICINPVTNSFFCFYESRPYDGELDLILLKASINDMLDTKGV